MFFSSFETGAINEPNVFLVPPPPPVSWGTGGILVDDRPYFQEMVAKPFNNESCSDPASPCFNGGVCVEATYRMVAPTGWESFHGDMVSPAGVSIMSSVDAPLWHRTAFADGWKCVCEFEHGGDFCDAGEWYREVNASTVFPPEIYNITLRTSVDNMVVRCAGQRCCLGTWMNA